MISGEFLRRILWKISGDLHESFFQEVRKTTRAQELFVDEHPRWSEFMRNTFPRHEEGKCAKCLTHTNNPMGICSICRRDVVKEAAKMGYLNVDVEGTLKKEIISTSER